MTLLWIPHSPLSSGAVRRDQHLIRHLSDQYRIISVTWETRSGFLSLGTFWKGLQHYSLMLEDGRTAYHVRRLPDVTRPFRRDKQKSMRLNQHLFRQDIRRIVQREDVDLMITAYSSYMTGMPPFDVDLPVIFDYLDCSEWTSASPYEKPYLLRADAVLCVSALAQEQARQLNANTQYLPNGADVARLRSASGTRVREKYGLSGKVVVSVIGLAVSQRHYFIEAVLRAKEQVPQLKCLLVGRSESIKDVLSTLPEANDTFIYTGPVPYSEVASYFAASDVGLYPADGVSYDDGRSPIKIFEYTALGIPVVAPPLREVKKIDFKNVILARPNASSFAEGIVAAARRECIEEPAIDQYDWKHLASKVSRLIETLASDKKTSDS